MKPIKMADKPKMGRPSIPDDDRHSITTRLSPRQVRLLEKKSGKHFAIIMRELVENYLSEGSKNALK